MLRPIFLAEENPAPGRCEQLASLYPANPFATSSYADAEQHLSGTPWLFGCVEGDALVLGCFGFLRSGRISRTLSIPSLPPVQDLFWAGLKDFCEQQNVTDLELNTYASQGATIPPLGEEKSRIQRYEFSVALDDPTVDPLSRMSMTHRQRVRKGIKAGFTARVTTDPRYLSQHVVLMGASMQRRKDRGESVPEKSAAEELEPYLTSGLCLLFQAVLNEEVASSMTVAFSEKGGYLHTGGTSPAGMNDGASHFLIYEILKASAARGISVFNLGGVNDLASGLAQYKKHFGANSIPLEKADFYVGNSMHKLVSSSAGLAKNILTRLKR